MRSVAIALLVLFMSGCASPVPATAPRFASLEAPEPGMARLYVLRPGFSKSLQGEAPQLLANGREVALVAHDSYTNLTLLPGKYTLSLKPGITDLALWATTIEFRPEAGKTYFLAIWMEVEATKSLSFVPLGGGIVAPMSFTSPHAAGVRHEFIAQPQALEALSGLAYLPPALPRYVAAEP